MRLLNIETLELVEFFDEEVPPYAILSHRWTDEELTFKEILKGRADVQKRGYRKLMGASRISGLYDVRYIWIDTCCIDKTSSAELSEAINSMYRWYQNAQVCLAYLDDVQAGPDVEISFLNSVWFTRSWTLQELLAPRNVEFYDCQWNYIGSKFDHKSILEEITAITRHALASPAVAEGLSVAEKMSWAADRTATRSEDTAYSLMGMLDINMPVLYGEGQEAFRRLQEEVLRRTSDTTVLCWGLGSDTYTSHLLAASPTDFSEVRGQLVYAEPIFTEFRITNVGLEVYGEVVRWDLDTYGILLGESEEARDTYMALVRKRELDSTLYRVGVKVVATERSYLWRRKRRLLVLWHNGDRSLRQNNFVQGGTRHGFRIETQGTCKIIPSGLRKNYNLQPTSLAGGQFGTNRDPQGIVWDFGDPMLPAVATLVCVHGETQNFSIDLSFDFDGRPCCLLYTQAPSDWRHVWKVSESFPESGYREEWQEECLMLPTQDIETGATFWYLRSHSNHSSTFAKVPAAMIGQHKEAWIYFIPPQNTRYWTFLFRVKETLITNEEG